MYFDEIMQFNMQTHRNLLPKRWAYPSYGKKSKYRCCKIKRKFNFLSQCIPENEVLKFEARLLIFYYYSRWSALYRYMYKSQTSISLIAYVFSPLQFNDIRRGLSLDLILIPTCWSVFLTLFYIQIVKFSKEI